MSRLFFAIVPDQHIKDILHDQADRISLKNNSLSRQKTISKDHLHMTLFFVGIVSDKTKNCLLNSCQSGSFYKFNLQITKITVWAKQQLLLGMPETIPDGLITLEAY
jgi:2'-5' RNA ligase